MCQNRISIRTRTRLRNTIAAAVLALSVFVSSGCGQKRDWAPVLQIPERPVLQEIPDWRSLPRSARETITDNMELVIRHTEALEQTIRSYNAWQAGEANN